MSIHQKAARVEQLAESVSQMGNDVLKAVLDGMGEGVVVADPQGRFLLFNPAAERILGYGATATAPTSWSQHYGTFLPDRVTPMATEQLPLMRAIAGEPVDELEVYIKNPKVPEGLFISCNARPIRDGRGLLLGVVVVFRDITAVRQKSEELARSNAELEMFASVASHDLQEPLRKIVSFGDLLAKRCGAALDEQGRDFLGRMQAASRRMSSLIEDILKLSRVMRDSQPFALVDLNEVIAQVLSDLEPRIRDCGARVEVGTLPTVHAHPNQMHQLLLNLLSNALKFHGAAPVISVRASAGKTGFVTLTITDNGIGFGQTDAERIFQPFLRLHNRSEYEGSGIGLAICRRIMLRHGGWITARSAPGEGAEFHVTLPERRPQ